MLFAAIFLVFSIPYNAKAQDYTTDLLAHWNFNEGSLGTASDSGAFGYHGTLTNMNLSNVWISPGKMGNSHLLFDGADDHIAFGSATNLNLLNDFTVTAWVKKSSANARGPVFTRGNPGSNGYAFGVGEAPCPVTAIKLSKFGVADICVNSAPQDTDWHHYAVTWSTTGTRAYVDGVLTGNSANVTNIKPSTSHAYVASNEDLAQFFPGQIDDLRFYSRVLSAADIAALYSQVGGPGTCDSARAGVMIFNKERKVMQYCNGSAWVAAGTNSLCGQASCGGLATERVAFVAQSGTGNHGGITGANETCQQAAQAANLRGTYYAWLADSNASSAPATRFEKPTVPYVMTNGTKIANNWADLIDNNLAARLERLPTGEVYPHQSVWSNVASNGTQKSADITYHCDNWGTNSPSYQGHRGGKNHTDSRWTDNGLGGACNNGALLYCFEQAAVSAGTCTNPDGVEGEIDFSTKHASMQYCNGSSWVNMGPKIAGISPADNIPTSGLVANWKLDDGIININSATAADSSGNGHTATLTNMEPSSDWLPTGGIDGGALAFDGVNEYAVTASNAAFSIKDLTLSAWIYIPGSIPASWRAIVWQSATGDNNYSLFISENANKVHFRWSNGWVGAVPESNMYMDSNMSIAPNTWYHIVGTYDDPTNTAKLYINGALDRVKTGANDPLLRNNPIQIGGIPGSYFPGRIDDVRIYNRDLNADEVEALYLGTGGGGNANCSGLGAANYNDSISGHCYYRVASNQTWANAKLACEARGDYLAVVTSERENEIIRENIVQNNNSWFGASDEAVDGEWRWHGGEMNGRQFWQGGAIGSPIDNLYNDWYTNEPSNQGGNEHCAAYTSHVAYHWNDMPCTGIRHYICERSPPSAGGSCTGPAGAAGEMVYNSAHNVMQYCNGANWVEIK